MENGIDGSYLHKKFKKQLSIEPKLPKPSNHHHHNNHSSNDDRSREMEATSGAKSEEKTRDNHDNVTIATRRKDNNDIIISVPNQSTNDQSDTCVHSSSSTTNDKSSISSSTSSSLVITTTAGVVTTATVSSSVLNRSPPSECISLVVSNNFIDDRNEDKRRPISASADILHSTSFDTKLDQEPTSHTTSSILDSVHPTYSTLKVNHHHHHPQEDDQQSSISSSDKNNAQSGGKHVCPYCNLVCSKPSVLQKHIRAHTNERPYPCDSCGFSFKTRSNLYKHCRSRTHANRVMGNKAQESNDSLMEPSISPPPLAVTNDDVRFSRQNNKPYKPRFHQAKLVVTAKENNHSNDQQQDDRNNSELLAYHINEIISKNNSIVNSNNNEAVFYKKRVDGFPVDNSDEPLNLTKNRKRCMSEIVEPVAQKSLIKELLLKNLNSDMQCPHCKMIFQTVTELELHKLRSCKGFVKPGAKYSRSSSVNVASILTQNKNAFDNIPHLQNAGFPLKSPGPFLGKTRLVESDKNKSFSFDDGLPSTFTLPGQNERYLLSPLTLQGEKDRKQPVKLFGGEVKITHTSGETKSFKIDAGKEKKYSPQGYVEYSSTKLSENRVVKSSLQSGGTVLTNKPSYPKSGDLGPPADVIRVYDSNPSTPTIDLTGMNKHHHHQSGTKFTFDETKPEINHQDQTVAYKYTNMDDFSQNAVKSLVPNLKQPNLAVPGVPAPTRLGFSVITTNSNRVGDDQNRKVSSPDKYCHKIVAPQSPNLYNPMNLYVNGKVVRYVPGIPGPVVTEEPVDMARTTKKLSPTVTVMPTTIESKPVYLTAPEKSSIMVSPKSPEVVTTKSPSKKFARPNSLALKPTTNSLKQHHGLTPTMFNQILISPDTPRVAKKYVQQFIHGNYFSYLGLKCSTRNVYCTLNKTQPFYVPHYKKLSMYSEWRQQDTKTDKLYVSAYDSRQQVLKYTMAGKSVADLIVHSSYKFVVCESPKGEKGDDLQKSNAVLGGYECNEDYTYIRGRGRGRYVCDQCGIRCKKPSMLKKHIRTHSNDRPYTCNHCNFSFKTKGNLTKHMKSKAHTKNYAATGSSSSSTQQSGTQSSESDTDDSGMDSSDESTRREEHEAAYGLLSLSQKTSHPGVTLTDDYQQATTSRKDVHLGAAMTSTESNHSSVNNNNVMDTEEIAYVTKSIFVRNKILDENRFNFKDLGENSAIPDETTKEARNLLRFLGNTGSVRSLTYPYTSPSPCEGPRFIDVFDDLVTEDKLEEEPTPIAITQFDVIQRYAPLPKHPKECDIAKSPVGKAPPPPVLKVNDSIVLGNDRQDLLRKRKLVASESFVKVPKTDEVMDLSMAPSGEARPHESPSSPPVRLSREQVEDLNNAVYRSIKKKLDFQPTPPPPHNNNSKFGGGYRGNSTTNVIAVPPVEEVDRVKNNGHVVVAMAPLQEQHRNNCESPKSYKSVEYDNSAMDTLAYLATKQEKLGENTLAKKVASEYLKSATEKDGNRGREHAGGYHHGNEVSDMIVKPEGSKSCSVCGKSFSKPSQLRLHMNIHYLERPFRCHSCSVSFRSKGHLQKHERSASHHNKLSSSPAQSSSEPRPFKCVDCNIAFRIHGHLAKHLRSKMHIMKLECLAKIPFGLYAELERSNILLTEINTADGDQCLESLKTLAKKVFINDPNKFNKIEADS